MLCVISGYRCCRSRLCSVKRSFWDYLTLACPDAYAYNNTYAYGLSLYIISVDDLFATTVNIYSFEGLYAWTFRSWTRFMIHSKPPLVRKTLILVRETRTVFASLGFPRVVYASYVHTGTVPGPLVQPSVCQSCSRHWYNAISGGEARRRTCRLQCKAS